MKLFYFKYFGQCGDFAIVGANNKEEAYNTLCNYRHLSNNVNLINEDSCIELPNCYTYTKGNKPIVIIEKFFG